MKKIVLIAFLTVVIFSSHTHGAESCYESVESVEYLNSAVDYYLAQINVEKDIIEKCLSDLSGFDNGAALNGCMKSAFGSGPVKELSILGSKSDNLAKTGCKKTPLAK